MNDNTVDVGDINVAMDYAIGSPAYFFILDGFLNRLASCACVAP